LLFPRNINTNGDEDINDDYVVWNSFAQDFSSKFVMNEINLYQFIHELDLSSKSPPKAIDSIPCFTIHASKGLEFKHVYLIGVVEDILPSYISIKKESYRRKCRKKTEIALLR
jgi:DNA helicase-2/ATP-dependent DNA helicase PcrA